MGKRFRNIPERLGSVRSDPEGKPERFGEICQLLFWGGRDYLQTTVVCILSSLLRYTCYGVIVVAIVLHSVTSSERIYSISSRIWTVQIDELVDNK